MRAVFIGAGAVAVMCARILLKRGHEVVIIERSKERIDRLAEELDCGFIHGDGGTPAILREGDPDKTDFLFCLTSNDQTNIIASLVGRSLGFARVVTKIENPEFDHICIELGLEDTIVPSRTIGRYLADMFIGSDPLDLSALVKDEARVFSFIVRQEDAGSLDDLDLPEQSRVICYYRDGRFRLPGDDGKLQAGDEVVLISHSRNLPALKARWAPHPQPV
ncbi:MAG: TrkA family potassium uptake protein [Gallionellaceae bacterium]|nr:TrkA family potassium uptake protein [Gallionellaceae bacterium]